MFPHTADIHSGVSGQKELVNRATAKESYDDLSDEIARLREEKQRILTERAQERGKVEMKEQAWKGHPGGCLFSVLATVRFSEVVAWEYPF